MGASVALATHKLSHNEFQLFAPVCPRHVRTILEGPNMGLKIALRDI